MRRPRVAPAGRATPALLATTAAALVLSALGVGCRCGSSATDGASDASASPDARPSTSVPARAGETVVLDVAKTPEACVVAHRGALVDPDAAPFAAIGGSRLLHVDPDRTEREGATWIRVHDRALVLGFVATDDIATGGGVVLEVRARGASSRSAAVILDGHPVGTVAFARGETTTPSVRAPGMSLPRGAHEVELRFAPKARGQGDVLAEIDWVHVGPGDADGPYQAPTLRDAVVTAQLGGASQRAISLRGNASVRCTAAFPEGATLRLGAGTRGGDATFEVRLVRDRHPTSVLLTRTLTAPAASEAFAPLEVPLPTTGEPATLEIAVTSATKGARALFGEPRVVAPTPPVAARPTGKGVVLVVSSSTGARSFATYGGSIEARELGALARSGVVFEAHRASAATAQATVASMLTGLSPAHHGVVDREAALPEGVPTLAALAREAGVRTGLFSASPLVGAAQGFTRGFAHVVEVAPTEAADRVYSEAEAWASGLKGERFLAVVVARGGHPPWDATTEELGALAPAGYAGTVDPKRAGEILGAARGRLGRIGDADRERAWALHRLALEKHDALLGGLVAGLARAGRDADTSYVVTADVGVDPGAQIPVVGPEALSEAVLALPFVVRPPAGSALPAPRVVRGTSSEDVAPTVLGLLGLVPPTQLDGADALGLAASPSAARPVLAVHGSRLALRWGSFVLAGALGQVPRVCDLGLEPECVSDQRASLPLVAEALHLEARTRLAQKPLAPRAPLPPDPSREARLRAWGQ